MADQSSISPADILTTPLICSSRKEVLEMFCTWEGFVEEELTIVGRYNLIFNVLLLVENNVGAALAIAGAIHHRENQIKFIPFRHLWKRTVFWYGGKRRFWRRQSKHFEEIQACFASIEISLTSIGRYVDQAVT